jgi:hypothetical protein
MRASKFKHFGTVRTGLVFAAAAACALVVAGCDDSQTSKRTSKTTTETPNTKVTEKTTTEKTVTDKK